MKMMDCSALGTLVANHEPIELIDVRSRTEFNDTHIPGARSLPFGDLAASSAFRRRRVSHERVYVISAEGHAEASLATGMLRSAGCENAVAVDGGMKAWIAGGFPVEHKGWSITVRAYLATALLTLMAGAAAVAGHEFSATALLLIVAAGLLARGVVLLRKGGKPLNWN